MAMMSRKRYLSVLVCISVMIVLSACGGGRSEPTPTPTKTPMLDQISAGNDKVETPTPVQAVATTPPQAVLPTATPIPERSDIAPFTGLPAENPETLKQRPVFICVNNDAVGRAAHYGLSKADFVYEYIVDGFTLTRLTAMYQGNDTDRVGPVRSARMPNVWMTYMYDGALACSGGSDEVRYLLKNEVGFPYLDADIDDPNQDRYFQSIGTDYRTRMQTSPDGVRRWLADNGLEKDWSRSGFEFSEATPPNASGGSSDLAIRYPGGNQVEWQYDDAQRGYVRYQGGQQHIDNATGQPIVAQNVIVIAAEHTLTDIEEDSLGTKGVDIALYGYGDMRVFRDGQVYEGTWRADPENPPRWLGPGEVVIPLRPGQTWIQVVQDLNDITY
jgi:hypothetical protein